MARRTTREELVSYFTTAPALQLHLNTTFLLKQEFADLERPSNLHRDRRSGRQDTSQLHPSIGYLLEGLRKATAKFEYARTSSQTWLDYMRFADERLVRTTHGYAVRQDRRVHFDEPCINRTKEQAQDWFRNRLIPALHQHKDGQKHFVLGEPGTGKSTLIKYLINTNWSVLAQRKTIVSRFEFLKFLQRWKLTRADLRCALDDYLSLILLRDVLYMTSYDLVDGTAYRKNAQGPFAKPESARKLKKDLIERFADLLEDNDDIDSFLRIVQSCMRPNGLDIETLADTRPRLRALFLKLISADHRLALVLDGMDCIAIEDFQFDSDRMMLLRHIHKNVDTLTSFLHYFPQGAPIRVSKIFVMRENTFAQVFNEEKIDIPRPTDYVFYVAKLENQLVVYNALRQSVANWCKEQKADHSEAMLTDLVMSAFDLTMRIIANALGARSEGTGRIYDIFCGNVRMQFEFLEKILWWFIEEAIREGLLKLTNNPKLEDVLLAMTGGEGRRLLRRRKYRLVERLLFTETPWFENAMRLKSADPLKRQMGFDNARGGDIADNQYFTGFVDNLWNYHNNDVPGSDDHHCILEKVRVLQLLYEFELDIVSLEAVLFQKFGFISKSLPTTVIILLRSQMLRLRIRDDTWHLQTTERGYFLYKHLINAMAYVEHIFHRTLLPAVLVHNVKDQRRDAKIEAWTLNSIRNSFIFLTYIAHVESNKANSRSVDREYRIYPAIQASVLASLQRILREDEQRNGHLASQALGLVKKEVNHWRAKGLLIA